VPELQTGEPTTHWTPLFDTGALEAQPITATESPADNPSEPLPTFVAPEFVPGTNQSVKRWHFALVVAVVWTVAAVIGLGIYQWWFQSVDKTGPVFVLLVYLVVCTVAGLLAAMVQNKPLVSTVAIALMSAPLASTAAAAALYGAYVFQWIDR
jgi:RsiW-degrading membrane proteinase PrsW (M82 family)